MSTHEESTVHDQVVHSDHDEKTLGSDTAENGVAAEKGSPDPEPKRTVTGLKVSTVVWLVIGKRSIETEISILSFNVWLG